MALRIRRVVKMSSLGSDTLDTQLDRNCSTS